MNLVKLVKQGLNLGSFLMGNGAPLTAPAKVQWEITYRCNFRCGHCQIWKKEDFSDELSREEAIRVLESLARAGVPHVSFSGGEFYLVKWSWELVNRARELGISVGVNTNASCFRGNNIKRIIDEGPDMLYISLDGADEQTHDTLRGIKGAFRQVIDASRAIVSGRKNKSPKVFWNVTINKTNIDQFRKVIELASQTGVDGVTMSMIQQVDKYSPNPELIPSKQDLDVFLADVEKTKRENSSILPHSMEYFRRMENSVLDPDSLYSYPCVAGFATCQIHPNGDLFPCPVAFKKMGNLNSNDFADVWKSAMAREVRSDIRAGRHPICWFDCVAPINVMMKQAKDFRLGDLVDGTLFRHIISKLGN